MKKFSDIDFLCRWIQHPSPIDGVIVFPKINPELFSGLCDQIITNFRIKYCQHGYIGRVNTTINANDIDLLNLALPLHTDGYYHDSIPEYAILYCKYSGPVDIPTEFLNSKLLIKQLDTATFDILSKLDLVYIANDRREYIHPLIDSYNNDWILNWVNSGDFRINLHRTVKKLPSTIEIINSLHQITQHFGDHNLKVSHVWSEGDLVLWNNREYIHGRGEIMAKKQTYPSGSRLLHRVYFDSPDLKKKP